MKRQPDNGPTAASPPVLAALACAALTWPGAALAGSWNGTLLDNQSNLDPYLTGDGSRVAFSHLFGGAWNIWRIQTDGSSLTQVTNYPAAFNGDEQAAISDDGQRIVFFSNADPLGTNADGSREVFTVTAAGGGLTQVTATAAGNAFSPSITDDGSTICFNYSGADLTGQNPDLNSEVYAANFNGSGLVQSSASSNAVNGAISGNGSTVIWSSALFALNTVFRSNPDGSGTVPLVTLQNAFVLPRHPITDDGSLAVFRSNDDPFATNADGNNEVFLVNTITSNVSQVTQTTDTGGLGNANLRPFFSGDGSLILFMTQNDITGQNSDFGAELFTVCLDGSNLTQITNSATDPIPTNADWQYLSIDDTADTIAVITRHDFTGQNPGGSAFKLWALKHCPADIDGDGMVGIVDLLALLGAWGPCAGCCPADFDGDGSVGITDLLLLLGTWGPCP